MSTGEKVFLVLAGGAVLVVAGTQLINATAVAKATATNSVINNSAAQAVGVAGALKGLFGGATSTPLAPSAAGAVASPGGSAPMDYPDSYYASLDPSPGNNVMPVTSTSLITGAGLDNTGDFSSYDPVPVGLA